MAINIDLKNIDIKGALGKLGALKSHMNLVVPLIIALVAGLLFIPTALLGSALRQKVQTQSLQRASQLDRMVESPVSRYQYQLERKRIEKEAQDANRIEQLAIQTTQRELLSNRIFPAPKDTSVLIFEEFGKRYRAGVDECVRRIGGQDAPSAEELGRHIKLIQGQQGTVEQLMGLSQYGLYGPAGGARGQRGPATAYDAASQQIQQIIDALCQERAKRARCYVNPKDVAGYNFWEQYRFEAGTDQAVRDCWYWQLGYWVVQDVFDTIDGCNRGSQNVLESPVKRIVRVSFSRPMIGGEGGMYPMAGVAQGSAVEPPPRYVLDASGGLTESCTARVCNYQVDVIHFYLSVIADSSKVMDFVKQLCSAKEHTFTGYNGQPPVTYKHNQITVLEMSLGTVDRTGGGLAGVGGMYGYGEFAGELAATGEYGLGMISHQLYRYGEQGVVQLDLVCEYLFEKAGYESIKPEVVKKDLEAAAAPAGPAKY